MALESVSSAGRAAKVGPLNVARLSLRLAARQSGHQRQQAPRRRETMNHCKANNGRPNKEEDFIASTPTPRHFLYM